AGDYVLLIGSCNLASARRIPRWYAWVTHRSELVVGRTGEDYSTAEPSNVFIAPSRIPASFSVPLDFCEPLATLNVDSSTSAATVAGGSGGFCSKFLLRSCRRKSSSFTSQPSITVGSGTKTGAKTHSPPAPGLYRRVNLNMPPCLPVREDIIDHALDSPLTQVGMFVAASCGRALAEAGIRFSACYASPALRCVQTACQLLHAADHSNLAVRIEPFLFEWLGWYSGKLPNFLSPSILSEMGYNVDTGYRSVSSTEQLDLQESVSQFYARSTQLVKDILDQHQTTDANILVVGHAATLDSCTRGLLKKRFRSGGGGGGNGISSNGAGGGMNDVEELHRRCASVPYCGLLCAVEGGRRWRLEEPPIPPFTHGQNIDFDWRQFQSYSFCSFDIK
uniref:Phosphoglycerate mutase family protein n=1 Tax=Mesocestoides corti TaxID=53468 RepID=A0A5K3EJS1_MESCO